MPLLEHPLDKSWGCPTSHCFARASLFGAPDGFRTFLGRFHVACLVVLLDWVPGHFPNDEFCLGRFDGTAVYEHSAPRKGEHLDWGTYVFNYGDVEVSNFRSANALSWLKKFHIDGIRLDAVASMLSLDESREEGEWVPN
ncbi:1,4-alpha-glucan branching enzyme, partial [Oceanidesulfovibrio marinus]